ncbi:MAG: TlyA family RNA methyltransferase [Desulfovibrionales bacterium]
MSKKKRADQVLYEAGLAESREKAKRLIMAGKVSIRRDTTLTRVEKPGQQLAPDTALHLEDPERFVSRGGEKLLTAIEHFGLHLQGVVCLDAGASTGGFTDCLLQSGATRVYAVDVGRNQLHEKLKADCRVVSMEGVNLRHAGSELLPELVDLITVDCSFISLKLILPACAQFLKPGGQVVALVKPQFELGPEAVGKGGVVTSPELRQRAVEKIVSYGEQELGFTCCGVIPSRITGPKGNQEYLVLFETEGDRK